MEKELHRTNETFLTDDELILFDAMFDCNPHLPLLRQDIFSDVFNKPYCHNFDDKELEEVIVKFCKTEYFHRYLIHAGKREIECVGLTEKGGELWEKERHPQWEFFCVEQWDMGYSNHRNELSIYSLSAEVTQDFLAIARECKLYHLREPMTTSITTLNDYDLVPWKKFNQVYCRTVVWQDEEPEAWIPINWEHYQKKRYWWRMIEELNALPNESKQ
jgi:hypothetical protein